MTPGQLRDLLVHHIGVTDDDRGARLRFAPIRLSGPRTWVSPVARSATTPEAAPALAVFLAQQLARHPEVQDARADASAHVLVTLTPPTPADLAALSTPTPAARRGGGAAVFGTGTGDRTPADLFFRIAHAHARLCTRRRTAAAVGIVPAVPLSVALVDHPTETALFDVLLEGADVAARAALRDDARPWVGHLRELADRVHAWSDACPSRPAGDDRIDDVYAARVGLGEIARSALARGLAVFDIEAPTHL